ncbi:hypothetical protein DdX_17053 [Ditylenchus destructor]|uniref:Uncharacterized protein n=1 Tax=Ditylenchus destructor TaxID=166010 RepID=A0AAD4MP99_9BILA|nr:hypothetical protein DdX_17053 [Ditylenchus destructor]
MSYRSTRLVGDGIVAKELAKGTRRNELNTPGTHHFTILGQLAASARDMGAEGITNDHKLDGPSRMERDQPTITSSSKKS